jgi:hypothetical protein
MSDDELNDLFNSIENEEFNSDRNDDHPSDFVEFLGKHIAAGCVIACLWFFFMQDGPPPFH